MLSKKHPVLNLQAPLTCSAHCQKWRRQDESSRQGVSQGGHPEKISYMVMKCHCDDENENVKKNDLHQVAAHAIGRVGRVDWLKIETI